VLHLQSTSFASSPSRHGRGKLISHPPHIHNIMRAHDDRLLVIVGPCSIHDPPPLDYARRLAVVREQYKDTLEVVMRVYFESPAPWAGRA
jgi:phospho-2-dehydro-3-deoxyheptonate aldolase